MSILQKNQKRKNVIGAIQVKQETLLHFIENVQMHGQF